MPTEDYCKAMEQPRGRIGSMSESHMEGLILYDDIDSMQGDDLLKSAEITITYGQLLACIAEITDMVSPALVDHHRRVAYVSLRLAEKLNMPGNEQKCLLGASLLHDIGAITLQERMDTLTFDMKAPKAHTEAGWALLDGFVPLARETEIIRDHHAHWRNQKDDGIHPSCFILHLADRLSVLVSDRREILAQGREWMEYLLAERGRTFSPDAVDALRELAEQESFWFDLISPRLQRLTDERLTLDDPLPDEDAVTEMAKLFSRFVDFRSRFTATHSFGVATTAGMLAELTGHDPETCRRTQVAGLLHDIGKLGIPSEIIEKPGKLTSDEFNVMKLHPYLAWRALSQVNALEEINRWGTLHHERMDGTGYPFRIPGSELPQITRLMMVADMFTALTEDRPYRQGMPLDKALAILETEVARGKLDPQAVEVLRDNLGDVDRVKNELNEIPRMEYEAFKKRRESM